MTSRAEFSEVSFQPVKENYLWRQSWISEFCPKSLWSFWFPTEISTVPRANGKQPIATTCTSLQILPCNSLLLSFSDLLHQILLITNYINFRTGILVTRLFIRNRWGSHEKFLYVLAWQTPIHVNQSIAGQRPQSMEALTFPYSITLKLWPRQMMTHFHSKNMVRVCIWTRRITRHNVVDPHSTHLKTLKRYKRCMYLHLQFNKL